MEEILQKLGELSLDEKQALLVAVNRAIDMDEEMQRTGDMVKHYIKTMAALPVPDFLTGRERNKSQARIVLTECLIEKGFNISKIARIFKMNHASIIHYRHVWDDAIRLPKIYKDIITLYNKFKESI